MRFETRDTRCWRVRMTAQICGSGNPFCTHAARRVFNKQTGNRHRPDAARHRRNRARDGRGFGKSDVADDARPFLCRPRPARRLMPTSITMAPGLIQSPRIISGLPMAATSRSARRQTAGQIARLGMADGDGGVLVEQQLRHRLADDVGAADHHRLQPGERAPARSWPASRSRAACRAPAPGRPLASRPTLSGWKPSTSLAGSMAAMILCASICGGSGNCTRMPFTCASALSVPMSSSSAASLVSRRQLVVEGAHAGLRHRLGLAAHIDLARRIVADQHHRDAGREPVRVFKARDVARRPCRADRPRWPCRR